MPIRGEGPVFCEMPLLEQAYDFVPGLVEIPFPEGYFPGIIFWTRRYACGAFYPHPP